MEFEVSDQERMIRGAVAKLTERYGRAWFLSRIGRTEGTAELWRELGKAGFLGTLVSEADGGAGLGMAEMAVLLEALAERGVPLLFLVVSAVMGTLAVVKHGNDEQKARFLPPLVSGEKRFCFALTEPDAGSNSFAIATRARREGDVYRVSGSKTFISGVNEADFVLTVVRTDDPAAKGRAALTLLVIPTGAAGLEMRKIDVAIEGPESQFLLFFDDVRVPVANRIGPEGEGARHLFDVLNAERIAGAAIGVGLGRYVLAKSVAYAKERVVFGAPIGSRQGLAHPMAQVASRLALSWLMTQKAAWLVDAGRDAAAEANIAKYEAAEAAITACDLAIEVHGGNGFSREFDVITVWPWARLLRTAPVSRELILSFIAEHVLGLPRPS